MEISFYGGASEVGRSCVVIDDKRKRYMLDCGVKLDSEDEHYPAIEARDIRRVNHAILSHAHLDHSGYMPGLYAEGYRGDVLLTKPTRDLIQLLLADYIRLNKGASAYKEPDVKKMLGATKMLELGAKHGDVVFHEAGHILGSVMTELNLSKKVLYTGDVNVRPSRLLDGAARNVDAEVLIIESTYGAKEDVHVPIKDASNTLIKSINATFAKGGKVVIPTFAIGRGQEILFTLENFLRSGALKKTPIYLDGMITKALRIYRHNAIYLKREVQRRILTSDDDPFKSEFYFTPETKDRSDVIAQERAIILTTSGMLNGGPVLTYLKKMAPEKKNKVILVGFQAKGTRGRELLEGADVLTIDDEKIPVNMEVDQAPFSGHSDWRELLELVRGMKKLKKIYVMHGEQEKAAAFAETLSHEFKRVSVDVPKLGETFRV
ncbi:Beta-Casp domain protein [Candidatus Norongarragalina meridionalis]|nr:Beta-Casp domain protein [Candidatus Norongarragalina meridionalis]